MIQKTLKGLHLREKVEGCRLIKILTHFNMHPSFDFKSQMSPLTHKLALSFCILYKLFNQLSIIYVHIHAPSIKQFKLLLQLISTSKPTQVTAEFSQHAIWVGGGHLGEARQNQDITVLQGTLIHRLGRKREEQIVFLFK